MDIKGFLWRRKGKRKMDNNYFYNSIAFTQLKRKIYTILFPFFIMGFSFILFLLILNNNMDFVNTVTFTLLCGGFTICYVFLLANKNTFPYVEITVFIIAVAVFLLRMYNDIIFDLGIGGNVHIGNVSYWVSLFYILIYFTFRGRKAFILSLVIFSLTILPGAYHILFSPNFSSHTLDSLIQFYISNIGFVIALYYFQRIIDIYLEASVAHHNANTDYLTELPNRRQIDQLLYQKVEKSKQKGFTFSVILFDIDFFKKVNDKHGHDAGDCVLKELAGVVKENIRDTDHFGRWGGEEFIILVSREDLLEAELLSERVRQKIEDYRFKHGEKITCSFGVVELLPGESVNQLLKRADQALYKAKEHGRNTIIKL